MAEQASIPDVGVSCYERCRLALIYIEAAADRPVGERFGDHASLKMQLKELSMRTSKAKTGAKREAPQYLTSMIRSMEKLVVGDGLAYWRAYAWLKLLTIWSLVRGEDSTWLDARTLVYEEGLGISGKLSRTKTTGPGKKVKTREVHVCSRAYVAEPGWLKAGWEIWQRAPTDREHFTLLPTMDYKEFRQWGAETQDRIAMTRHLLAYLV